MTQPDRLTIEQADEMHAVYPTLDLRSILAGQLADALRENERLREALGLCTDKAIELCAESRTKTKTLKELENWVHDEIGSKICDIVNEALSDKDRVISTDI